MESTPAYELSPPRFITTNPLLLAGTVERYDCKAPVGIPDQWQRFGPLLAPGKIPGRVDNVSYGVSYNFDETDFDYMCGVEVANASNVPDGFKSLQIPSLKYVVFSTQGHIAGIRAMYSAIWSNWFPTSGHTAVNAPTLERYGPEFNGLTGMGGYEIWIAIQA